ncbi:GntR family transcriptional regulator [Herbaspirillum sp. YR522]|uniref:GntR family transcriptional regulator n=1 Tax=Herbaspirillum sp. YR522 TaxID=1144342 RepID=UPI00026FBBFB|nr:GntR family transcriptional regulator [Herbaspirillum sp. YR522]EJN08700.1 transcriptional regulator [Herbaspirillum sp. YR522]
MQIEAIEPTEPSPNPFEPMDAARESRSDQLRDALEEMIVSGLLRPGTRVDEQALIQQFGVSRTPMREAIKALVATGLLEVRQRQGVWVSVLSIPKLMEMFDTMAMFEGMCARYAARRATADEIAQLLDIQRRLEAEIVNADPEKFYAINAEFHDALYHASHTEFVVDQTRQLRRRVSMYRKHVTYLPGRMQATLVEHAQIIAAIQAKDPKAAAAAASDHVSLLGDDMVDFIAQLPRIMNPDQ